MTRARRTIRSRFASRSSGLHRPAARPRRAPFSRSAPASADVDDFEFESLHSDYTLGRDSEGFSTLRTVETFVVLYPGLRPEPRPGARDPDALRDRGHGAGGDQRHRRERRQRFRTRSRTTATSCCVIIGTDEFVHGRTTYVIEYQQEHVVRPFADELEPHQEFYWDVNGTGWAQPFGSVSADVHLADGVDAGLERRCRLLPGVRGRDRPVRRSSDGDGGRLPFRVVGARPEPEPQLRDRFRRRHLPPGGDPARQPDRRRAPLGAARPAGPRADRDPVAATGLLAQRPRSRNRDRPVRGARGPRDHGVGPPARPRTHRDPRGDRQPDGAEGRAARRRRREAPRRPLQAGAGRRRRGRASATTTAPSARSSSARRPARRSSSIATTASSATGSRRSTPRPATTSGLAASSCARSPSSRGGCASSPSRSARARSRSASGRTTTRAAARC